MSRLPFAKALRVKSRATHKAIPGLAAGAVGHFFWRGGGRRISGRGDGVAPTALGLSSELFPALTGWANFCRAYGAGETRSGNAVRVG
jgi:hypothetical protein